MKFLLVLLVLLQLNCGLAFLNNGKNKDNSLSMKMLIPLMFTGSKTESVSTGEIKNSDTPQATSPARPVESSFSMQYSIPPADSQNIGIYQEIYLYFNSDIDPKSIDDSKIIFQDNLRNPVPGKFSIETSKLIFKPASPLSYDKTYQFKVLTGIKDNSGVETKEEFSFAFKTILPPDPPQIESVSPTRSALNIAVTTPIKILMTKNLKKESIISSTLIITDGVNQVAGSIQVSGNEIKFTPSEALKFTNRYYITLKKNILDTDSLSMIADESYSFYTEAANTALRIIETDPLEGDKGVLLDKQIKILFNRYLDVASINPGTVFLSRNGIPVPGQIIATGNAEIIFNPDSWLIDGSQYEFALTSTIKDIWGNALAQELKLKFIASVPLQIVAGENHTCVLLYTREIRCWGSNLYGQLGTGTGGMILDLKKAKPILFADDVDSITAGANHTCALMVNGRIYCWGQGKYGQHGYGHTENIYDPTKLSPLPNDTIAIKSLVSGYDHNCLLYNTGEFRCWGRNSRYQLGYNHNVNVNDFSKSYRLKVPRHDPISIIAAGRQSTFAAKENGDAGSSVVVWGDNSYGYWVWGSYVASSEWSYYGSYPVYPFALYIKVGGYHQCALHINEIIACGGNGSDGQLGYASYSNINTFSGGPIDLAGRLVKSISLGASHSCAVLDTGNVKCWGNNSYGQLGKGDYANANNPVILPEIAFEKKIKSISSGLYHNCVVLINGAINCWGWGMSGQLGNNSQSNITNPSLQSSQPLSYFDSARDNIRSAVTYNIKPSRIALDSSDNLYIIGSVDASIDGQINNGGYDIAFFKFDSNLNRIQTKLIGSSTDDFGVDIALDSQKNILFLGKASSSFHGLAMNGQEDIYLAKFDSNMNVKMENIIGGPGRENPTKLGIDTNDNIFISYNTSGETEGYPDPGIVRVNGSDLEITRFTESKYDSSGNRIWTIQPLGPLHSIYWLDYYKTSFFDPLGNYFLGTYSFTGGTQISKYGFDSSSLFSTQLYASEGGYNPLQDIYVNSNNVLIYTGACLGPYIFSCRSGNESASSLRGFDMILVKADSTTGTSNWIRTLGETATPSESKNQIGRRVVMDSQNNIYVAGTTGSKLDNTQTYYGGEDLFLAKYDQDGNLLWVKQFGTTADDAVTGIAINSKNQIIIVGHTKGIGLANQRKTGGYDMYIEKFDSNGNRLTSQ